MRILPTILLAGALPAQALAGPCIQWRAPEKVGALDPQFLPEESGVADSRTYVDRLYHNNDSGDGPYFYLTDNRGGATQRVTVSGFEPHDVEDIALGPCAGAASCLFLGDIGDNAENRTSVTFIEIAEQVEFPGEVAPLRILEAHYPDGPHNAEAFAIHPDGDLYLITKGSPARIYRLTAAQLAAGASEVQTFAHVGEIDLPRYIALVPPLFVRGNYTNRLATAMDISPDGSRTAILTYRELFEWNQDLSKPFDPARTLEPGSDYSITPLAPLIQAESVAYLAEGDGVLYSTELAAPATEAPLYRQFCARR